MSHLPIAICDRELNDGAPDWVHLFPLGEMTGRDGRRFSLSDPQALIDRFNEGAADLPIDYEHQADADPKAKRGPVPAAGWIKELKARADGLWGRLDLDGTGQSVDWRKSLSLSQPVLLSPQAR